MSALTNIFSALGLTKEIGAAVLKAQLDPTSENIQAVVDAYLANGQTPPGPLMKELVAYNYKVYPQDTYVESAAWSVGPWVLAGAAVFLLLVFGGRKRG